MTPRGRRPAGSPDARDAILTAARAAFAREGFSTSLRGIARQAGVDPALVHHYFPDRARLFAQAVIVDAEGAGLDVEAVVERLASLRAEDLGEGVVRLVLTTWQTMGADRFTAVVRAAMTDDLARTSLQSYISSEFLEPVIARHTADRPVLRAQLIASQMLGLGVARWVTEVSEIAAADVEDLVAIYGPTIQRYATEDLPGA